jgi:hypothetical protein
LASAYLTKTGIVAIPEENPTFQAARAVQAGAQVAPADRRDRSARWATPSSLRMHYASSPT